MSEEELLACSFDAEVSQRQFLLRQNPVDGKLNLFVGDRGVRSQQRETEGPQILQRCSIRVANEKKRSGLVGLGEQRLAGEAKLQKPPCTLIPQITLIGKQDQGSIAPIDLEKGLHKIAGPLAQGPENPLVLAAGRKRRSAMPLTPVISPKRLDLRILGFVHCRGLSHVISQSGFEIAAEQILRNEALTMLERAKALAVEVIDDAQPADLRRSSGELA